MAVNPLYRDEYYFFSNMYDDSLITDFYRKISSETFSKSLDYQQGMIGRKRHLSDNAIFYKGRLGDFKIDDKYNSKVGLTVGSWTLSTDTLVIPYCNKKKYISTYGVSYKKIPMTDLYSKPDIFDRVITLQIGKYHFMCAYLLDNIDGTVSIGISNSASDGIISTNFMKLFDEYNNDEPVWIFTNEISRAYYADTSSASAFTYNSAEHCYTVKVPVTGNLNNIGTTVQGSSNSWDCLISYNSNKYGRKLLVSTPCTYGSRSSEYILFLVNEDFINMIKANNANFNIYFVNRPNRNHILHYTYDSTTSPIINLDYDYNPTGNINLEVFEVDSSTMCKERKLYDPTFFPKYFPNIFDFSMLNTDNRDLLIEVTEYSPGYTNQIMHNSIKPLIDSLGSEGYTEYVTNGYDLDLDGNSMGLQNYHPYGWPVSHADYINSEYYGNFRGYMLDKIENIIYTDPYLLASYYKWMANKNCKVKSINGTPKTVRFGTGKSGEFSGSNPVVWDTSIASVTSDDVQFFTEAHSYITYYSTMNKCPCMVYLRGRVIRPTCTRFYKGTNYVFFPISTINDALSVVSTDEELVALSPFTVDMYPLAYSSLNEAPVTSVTINSADDVIKLFEDSSSKQFSIDELVIYDNSTGKYLGSLLDLFDINMEVSKYIIENPGITDEVLISKNDGVQYLLTALQEVYSTMDEIPIVLGSTGDVSLNLNTFIDEMISAGSITKDDANMAFTHKVLDFNDITLTPKDNSLIGMTLNIYSRDFKKEYLKDITEGTYDGNYTTFVFNESNIDPDMSRYFVFCDGRYMSTATVTATDNKYNTGLTVSLLGDAISEYDDINLVHMPVGYNKSKWLRSNKVMYMKPAVVVTNDPDTNWPSTGSWDDITDGSVYKSSLNSIYCTYPFEDEANLKFNRNGFRLPKMSKSTYTMYNQYYDNARCKAIAIEDEFDYMILSSQDGVCFSIENDRPFIDLAKQNPKANSFNLYGYKHPLEMLYLTDTDA